jgi:hypothetical protein
MATAWLGTTMRDGHPFRLSVYLCGTSGPSFGLLPRVCLSVIALSANFSYTASQALRKLNFNRSQLWYEAFDGPHCCCMSQGRSLTDSLQLALGDAGPGAERFCETHPSGISLAGAVSVPPVGFASKARQHTYVNRREVHGDPVTQRIDHLFQAASRRVEGAGGARDNSAHKHAAFVVWITCPPTLCDGTFQARARPGEPYLGLMRRAPSALAPGRMGSDEHAAIMARSRCDSEPTDLCSGQRIPGKQVFRVIWSAGRQEARRVCGLEARRAACGACCAGSVEGSGAAAGGLARHNEQRPAGRRRRWRGGVAGHR